MARPRRTIRLYRYELEKLPEYSWTRPSLTTDWKMWRCSDENAETGWLVAQYVPTEDPNRIGIRVYEVEILEGPAPLQWGEWTKIGPRLWASFEYDIRRGHDVRKFHSVQLLIGDDPVNLADEFVRVTRLNRWDVFTSLCEIVKAAKALASAGTKEPELVEVTHENVTRLPPAMVNELGNRIWFLRGKTNWEAWSEAELERTFGAAQ